MTISINQLTSGMGLLVDGSIFLVVGYQHVKPGKGTAFARVKLKNVKTQQVLERTYKTADKLEDVALEERKLQKSYVSADGVHFIDLTTFEEVIVTEDIIGDAMKFLQDDMEVVGLFYEDTVLKIELPTFIIADIAHTEPGIKGDSSRAGTKPATIETGATILVPLFVDIDDKVKVDTRTGEYVERVKK